MLRDDHLPPRSSIFPTTASPAPGFWDRTVLTERAVEALYATRPWDYLARRVQPLIFDVNDRHFQPFLVRYDMQLDHWAQAYWEATHELPVPHSPAWARWRRRRNSRRSHTGDHLMSAFQLLVLLFQCWPLVPRSTNSTLEAALAEADAHEPWRRFFGTQSDAAGNCTVTQEHPAYSVRRLASKFIARGRP
ncbi:hypothetical protein PHMEG_00020588 [Phytophthora megakarya]|uniref:Uncharacterized protein n=1 Tax=Phytophthora megakarya TaxID=4795 RepID=A0A225VPW1_9STRA|nr:hypothetical protein PHMEG_00020588 [Phytophthora megakarya]